MKGTSKTSTIIFYVLVAVMIITSVVSFVSAISWTKKSFPGFLLYRFGTVASMGSRDWPGPQAGLKYLDRIVSVDGQPVFQGRGVLDIVRQKPPGTMVRYLVETKGETREVTVPVTAFSFKDFLSVFLVTFLVGFIIFVLGFIVYLLKPGTKNSWVFLILCFTTGAYLVTGFEMQSTYIFDWLNYLVVALFPATWFQLGLIFPDKKRILNRYPTLEYAIYIPAVALNLYYMAYYFTFEETLRSGAYSWIPDYPLVVPVTRIFTLFCIISLIGFVLYSLFRASSVAARQRARMILFGVVVAFLPPVMITILVVFFKIDFPWNLMSFFILCFPAAIAYSIVRHNLFDADEIIKRTVGYFIVTAIVVGAYALISVIFNAFMAQYQIAQSRAFPILFTLGVILIFNPLRNRIQSLVDRIFFRKEYDYGAIVENVSGAMTSLLDLPQILKRLTETFIEDMFINTSSVMLLTPEGTQYQVFLADGEQKQDVAEKMIKRDEPLMAIMEENKKELTKYDVIEDPKFREVSEPCAENFEALRASLMVPLVYQDKVIGTLNLGEKKSGKFYNREDIDLLRTLAHQGAVAIENARLFQENLEKQRMEEELNIARDLQMSMLPSECPTIEGLDIAAYSVSAMEVGGDFYDFIEMGDKKLAFVIGDVTGKSVSGALVMSASRSVFRMLSEEALNVSESMMRANRRLKKDVKSGMFVALLYAVIDAGDQTLTLCSAGQTQPIQLSADAEEANLVETEGDAFPLGILEEADYEETRRQLNPGDKVVFYTDGIVEAMNEQEEMFGFERLLEVVQAAKSMDSQTLLEEILGKVNEFTGAAAQHDDLTIIVVSIQE